MNLIYLVGAAAAAGGLQAADPDIVDPPLNETLVLPAGSEIELMVLVEIDSDRAQPGEPVKLRVNRPVRVGREVVVPVGTVAQGEVVSVTSSGAMMRRGRLAVKTTSLLLGDRTVALDAPSERRSRGGGGEDLWRLAFTPAWLLFARGNSAKLKAGELLSAEVETDVCFAQDGADYVPVACPERT